MELDYTIQIALVSHPNNNPKAFRKAIKKHFEKYRIETGFDDDCYSPVNYFLFSSYHSCFISKVNGFKFAQKLVFPEEIFTPNKFQIITGMIHSQSVNFDRIFEIDKKKLQAKQIEKPCFCIINIKLNNGLLIGNGKEYLEHAISAFKNELDCNELEYCILQSFSWIDLCLIVLAEAYITIREKLIKLRTITNVNITNSIAENSLYSSQKYAQAKIKDSHIIVDTHCYYGIHSKLFEEESYDVSNIILETELELHTKPGHLKNIADFILNENDSLASIFDSNNWKFLSAKSDYVLIERVKTLESNKIFFNWIDADTIGINNHIRTYWTRVSSDHETKESKLQHGIDDSVNKLMSYCINEREINDLKINLRTLQISRQLKEKILKMVYFYNNTICDQILYTYGHDFSLFTRSFIKTINGYAKESSNYKKVTLRLLKGNEIETIIRKGLNDFEKGVYIRLLNSYSMEDLNECLLDHNFSMHQLLTTYSVLANHLSNVFFPNSGFLLIINDSNTVANFRTLNYSIYHLTSPEFVCITLLKEIFNNFSYTTPNQKKFISSKNTNLQKNETLENLIKSERIDNIDSITKALEHDYFNSKEILKKEYSKININYKYLNNDIFLHTFLFKQDIDLQEYFLWYYTLQTPVAYNSYGNIGDIDFISNLIRIVALRMALGKDCSIECPSKELNQLWFTYFNAIVKALEPYRALLEKIGKEVLLNIEGNFYINIDYPNYVDSHSIGVFGILNNRFYTILKEYDKSNVSFLTSSINFKSGLTMDDLDLIKLFYNYMLTIRSFNRSQLIVLKRDKEGKPIINPLYYPDNTTGLLDKRGGIYFLKKENKSVYFKMRTQFIKVLWNLSLILKRDQLASLNK